MSWSNVRLIWLRELRDQWRDRRTMFTVVVLPWLLYPLLGVLFFQVIQFLQEHPARVWLVGAAWLPDEPPLVVHDRFAAEFCPEEESRRLLLTVTATRPDADCAERAEQAARQAIRSGMYDAVIYFPPDFSRQLQRYQLRPGLLMERQGEDFAEPRVAPAPQLFVDLASDKSRLARDRVERVLNRWREALVRRSLEARRVPLAAITPFEISTIDVSDEATRRAALWSKLLPFVVLIWALTGAFYPAIDLCAGEKERGTLETLLSSPADRREIVWGKLLTVMVFSAATALSNLFSLGVTGTLLLRQLQHVAGPGAALDLGPPPLAALVWLLPMLLPVSALFSALALAIAALARSSREGQYYLMPLLLLVLPLMALPMLPDAELNLGASLLPVTGLLLWLQTLVEGHYGTALRFAPPVLAVTAAGCWLALRWAVGQFESEAVLFRSGERGGMALWLRRTIVDRGDTPTVGQALVVGLGLLVLTLFAGPLAGRLDNWPAVARTALLTQTALIAGPVLALTLLLTRRPGQTLRLNVPRWWTLPAAVVLAIALHPFVTLLGQAIRELYPIGAATRSELQPTVDAINGAPLAYVLLLLALLPAVCEELAFRGFILSGLRSLRSPWAAVAISSLFFGLTHGLIQQALVVSVVGAVIACLALRSGSLLPGIAYHGTHNAIALLAGRLTADSLDAQPWLRLLFAPSGDSLMPLTYRWPWIAGCALVGAVVLVGFWRIASTSSTDTSQATPHG